MISRALSIMSCKFPRQWVTSPALSQLGLLTAVFAGGNVLSLLLRMAGGFLIARFTEPAVLGLFSGLGLVLGYAPFIQLGVLNGLNRELPYLIGKGDREQAFALAATAQCWALLVGGAIALVLTLIAVWYALEGDRMMAVGWAAQAVGVFLLFYAQLYLQITYRTRGDFARLAVINVAQNGLGLVLVLLVLFFGFYGLCLRSVLIGMIALALLWRWRPVRVAPAWDPPKWFHLFKVGGPIFFVGQIYAWWTVLDSTLVLHFLKTSGLGFYQLAVIAGTTLALLPGSLSQIVYPRMAEQYGRTGKLRDLIDQVWRPVLYLCIATVPAVLAGWFLIPPLTKTFLPQYSPGISAAQWTLVSIAISCLEPVNIVFNVVKRQDLYIVAIGLGLATYVVSVLWLTSSEAYLAAFPQAMVMGRIFFIICCYYLIGLLWKKETSPVAALKDGAGQL